MSSRGRPMIQNPYARKRPRPNPPSACEGAYYLNNRVAPSASRSLPTALKYSTPSTSSSNVAQVQRTKTSHGPMTAFATAGGCSASVVNCESQTRIQNCNCDDSNTHNASNVAQMQRPEISHGRNLTTDTVATAGGYLDPSTTARPMTDTGLNEARRSSFDSVGDASIDWEEAIRLSDQVSEAAPVAVNNNNKSSGSLNGNSTSFSSPDYSNGASTAVSTPNKNPSHNFYFNKPASSPARNRGNPYAKKASAFLPPGDRHESIANSSVSTEDNDLSHVMSKQTSVRGEQGISKKTLIKPINKPPPLRTRQGNGIGLPRPSHWSTTNDNNNNLGNKPTQNSKQAPNLSQQTLSQDGKVAASPARAVVPLHPMIASLPKKLQFSLQTIQPPNDDFRKELVMHANLSKPLDNGWTLFDHQKRAVLKALTMRRFILALDMGLGKTLIGCVWTRSFQKVFSNCKAIVLSPVSVSQEWARTAREATGLNAVVVADEKKSKKKKTKGAKKTANDDSVEENSTCPQESTSSITPRFEIHSWGKVPVKVDESAEHYVVVCDEAHHIQSMDSQRTQQVLKLVQPKRCVGVLLLTGTPLKNGRPSNLFPLLKAVRHPFGNHQRAYEGYFCGGQLKQFGRGPGAWVASGAANLVQLSEVISSHLLHQKKDDILKSLPPAKRVYRHIPVSHRMQLEHTKALKDMARAFAMSSSNGDDGGALLNASQKLRLISAMAKIDATVTIAKKVLEEEPAVVVFTSFVKVAKSLHEKLSSGGWKGELLTGETPPNKRQEMVDNFQEGISPVFVCTFGAGGVGLTLTAARTVILLDRPWTPGETMQAEDRVRRIGQKFSCTSLWISAFEVDKQIDAMLESKTQTTNAVLDQQGKSQSTKLSTAAPRISIFQLIKTILPIETTNGKCLSQTNIDSFIGNE